MIVLIVMIVPFVDYYNAMPLYDQCQLIINKTNYLLLINYLELLMNEELIWELMWSNDLRIMLMMVVIITFWRLF